MLIEVSKDQYRRYFQSNPHPYISEEFIGLVEGNTERVLRLMDENEHSMGIIVGVRDNTLLSPFSAPFGGFHYSHEYLMYETISEFLKNLKLFATQNNFRAIEITLPPDIYQNNMNAKIVSAMINEGYTMHQPDITNWVDLTNFDGDWIYSKVRNRCRKAIKNGLNFKAALDKDSKVVAYQLINKNRENLGRKIHMSLDDLMEVEQILPVDYFLVNESNGDSVGAGIFYRGHKKIVQGIFMGDDLNKRDLGAIDFLYLNLYEHYKQLGFQFIDFGISSQNGEPNSGLIRFKEIHNCKTALRYTFSINMDD